jgi:hypothetical protein
MANDWRACTFLACRVQSGVPYFLDEAVFTPFVIVAAVVRRWQPKIRGRGITMPTIQLYGERVQAHTGYRTHNRLQTP